jgi:hypothetical protein
MLEDRDILWSESGASGRDTAPPLPMGWIQWKGTDVCMDVHCECGQLTHIDRDFLYFVRCGACGKAYMVSGFVKFIPLTPEEVNAAEDINPIPESS